MSTSTAADDSMDDALSEIKALRERLAALERMAATMTKGDTMYGNSDEVDQEAIQRRLRAESWHHDPDMERVIQWLEADPDDPRITSGLRIGAALYRESKAAFMAERPPKLDTTKGESR